jgi:hypothetical protein
MLRKRAAASLYRLAYVAALRSRLCGRHRERPRHGRRLVGVRVEVRNRDQQGENQSL